MDNIVYSPSGNVSLHISEDKMSAWISIQKSGSILDEQEILNLIEQCGICYGIEEALTWLADNGFEKDYNIPFPIALCKPSQSEQILNLHFDKVTSYNPDIEWTFDTLKEWTFIEKGAVLADMSYNLFTDGGSIYNIFGDLTANPSNAIDLSIYLGTNVSLDGDKIIADTTGYPYLDNENRICVIDCLTYNGDVVDIKLPIALASSLNVTGSIIGAHLTILKDLTVSGDIKKAEIYSEGNLYIEGDISECQTTGIIVLKDMKVKNIFDSHVICRGRLDFENLIIGSRVIAEQQVCGNIDISTIYGSQILSAGSIEASSIGNSDGIETEIEVTISPFTKERMTQLTKQLIKFKEEPDYNSNHIDNINQELQSLEQQLSDDLSVFLNNDGIKSRFVKAHSNIYPGVYIRILKQAFTIKKYQTSAEYFEE